MISNGKIFVTGGPVPLDSPTYISRHADELALQAVRDNDYLTIVAPRQMGKTSLLYRLQAVAREYGHATVSLDLANFYIEDIEWSTWAQHVCSEIERQLRLFCNRDLYAEFPDYPFKLADFLSSLSQQVGASHIVILLDEAATVPSAIRDQFYTQIRTMFNVRAEPEPNPWLNCYNFVFAGVFQPERLIENRDNSPFNVSEIIQLPDFSLQETRQLLENLALIRPVEIADELVEAVYTWTGGHPYLIQRLASLLGKRLKSESDKTLDRNLVELLIPELMGDARDNIDHVVKRATASMGMWTSRILSGESVKFTRMNRELIELELSGAIKVEKDGLNFKCRIRNGIYEVALKHAYPASQLDTPDVEEVASLKRQLTQLRRNLLTIQEQKAKFIDPRSVSQDLKEAEKYTREEIARVEARLAELRAE